MRPPLHGDGSTFAQMRALVERELPNHPQHTPRPRFAGKPWTHRLTYDATGRRLVVQLWDVLTRRSA